MSFSEKLHELRIANNLSQKKMADALGVAQSSINYWEKGQRDPSIMIVEKIAAYFHVDVDYLLDLTASKEPITLAAHFDGDEYTEDELNEIRQFAEFVKSKRKSTD